MRISILASTLFIIVAHSASPQGTVVFSEMMFHPQVQGGEYVELFNRSANESINLSGWRVDGLDYAFPFGATIGPRGFLVLAKNPSVFTNTYGPSPAFGPFSGALSPSGQTLTLVKPGIPPSLDEVIDRVRYDETLPWPAGASYQLIDPEEDNARLGNWISPYGAPLGYGAGFTNNGWRFVSVTGSVGNGVSGGQRLVIYLGTELGSALIDDIQLVAGTNAAVGFNYVRNGGFESPLLEQPLLTNSWMVGTNYTNSTIVGGLTHTGSGALKLAPISFGNSVTTSPTTTNNKVIYQSLSPAPTIGSICTLSFWFWATNSSTNLSVKIVNSAALKADPTNINVVFPAITSIPPADRLSPFAHSPYSTTNLPPFPPLWINELQATNATGITDNQGEHDPWIEILNTGPDMVPLSGLYLSSFVPSQVNVYQALTSWAFPPGSSIGPKQYLVVFCDGQPAQTAGSTYHTSFRLPPGSGIVALSRLYTNGPSQLNGPQVLDLVSYAGLTADKSYGSYPDGQPFARYQLPVPTPGGPNYWPVLGNVAVGFGGTVSFWAKVIPGRTYRVEYKNDLHLPFWEHFSPDIPATSTNLTLSDAIGTNRQRFYRILLLD